MPAGEIAYLSLVGFTFFVFATVLAIISWRAR